MPNDDNVIDVEFEDDSPKQVQAERGPRKASQYTNVAAEFLDSTEKVVAQFDPVTSAKIKEHATDVRTLGEGIDDFIEKGRRIIHKTKVASDKLGATIREIRPSARIARKF